VFAARLRDDITTYSVYDVSDRLRMRGWLVPAYRMPPGIEDMAVLRVVVRNGFGRDLASMLIADLEREMAYLDEHGGQLGEKRSGFRH
jgi:glutamate decarboxylase